MVATALMEVYRGYATVPAGFSPSVVTIGNFDGVHLGHQALFRQTKASGYKTVVYTFEPHPVRILNPSLSPPRITPEDEKLRLIAEQGINATVVEPFTRDFAALDPDAWVREALVNKLRVAELIVGYDFTYGKGGKGNAQSLAEAARTLGFTLSVVSQQTFGGVVASSTKVREFVLGGKVDGARLLLGRNYAVVGNVVHGYARGRRIGFPTANVDTSFELIPKYGVYACVVTVDGNRFNAVTNVGLRPTVNSNVSVPTIEAHLFDFEGDLYGKTLRLEFVEWIRDEQRFDGLDALKAQIARDAARARELLA